jgi:hypothetical protein
MWMRLVAEAAMEEATVLVAAAAAVSELTLLTL